MSARLSSADLRAALAAAPEGPWTPSACNGDSDVDRGKVWAHLGWPIRSVCLLSANTKLDDVDWRAVMTLAALAPDLAAEVLELRETVERLRALLDDALPAVDVAEMFARANGKYSEAHAMDSLADAIREARRG